MGWIAKAKYDSACKTYGKEYSSIYDCQNYINEYLKDEMEIQRENMYRYFYEKGKHKKMPDKYDDLNDEQKLFVRLIVTLNVINNPILCWNTEQERYCDGFDF